MRHRRLARPTLVLAFGLISLIVLSRFLLPGRETESIGTRQQLGSLSTLQSNGGGEDQDLPDFDEAALPSLIDLADVPRDLRDENSMYDRWLRGELELEEKEGLASEEVIEALRESALLLEPAAQGRLVPMAAATNGIALRGAFDSLDINNCCLGGAAVPPDPDLAVGPNHIIAVVNVAFAIYDKTGAALVQPTAYAALFSGVTGCSVDAQLFDPNVLYDEQADRFMLAIDSNGSSYCLAVSKTADPTGSWYRYRFPTNVEGAFFDYPQAGVGRDAIYIGANMFPCSTCNIFKESRIWAFDKWAMYAGQPAHARSRSLGVREDTPQPAYLHGYRQGTWPTSGPHYFLTETDFDNPTYSVYAWSDPFGTDQVMRTGQFDLNVATGIRAGFPLPVPQPSLGQLAANDWRLQDAEYRNGYLWTTHTVSCNPGSGVVDCVRWAQVNPANGSVVQAGYVAGNGEYRFFGDLAVNHCGDMAVGYTKVNPSVGVDGYPGIWVAGRYHNDVPGFTQPEIALKTSTTPYTAFDLTPHRWGDYTGMTSDPNGKDLWYIGQYSKATGSSAGRWGTYIGRFDFSIVPPPLPPPIGGYTNASYLPLLGAANQPLCP